MGRGHFYIFVGKTEDKKRTKPIWLRPIFREHPVAPIGGWSDQHADWHPDQCYSYVLQSLFSSSMRSCATCHVCDFCGMLLMAMPDGCYSILTVGATAAVARPVFCGPAEHNRTTYRRIIFIRYSYTADVVRVLVHGMNIISRLLWYVRTRSAILLDWCLVFWCGQEKRIKDSILPTHHFFTRGL